MPIQPTHMRKKQSASQLISAALGLLSAVTGAMLIAVIPVAMLGGLLMMLFFLPWDVGRYSMGGSIRYVPDWFFIFLALIYLATVIVLTGNIWKEDNQRKSRDDTENR